MLSFQKKAQVYLNVEKFYDCFTPSSAILDRFLTLRNTKKSESVFVNKYK